MISTKDAVIHPPKFEKVASRDLSTDSSEWNDEIIKFFFEEIPYLPKEMGTEVVVNDIDDNKGYGKGSVVVWFNDKKINFPIIIKDYKLSPFDIFIYQENGITKYLPVSLKNIKEVMASTKIGKVDKEPAGGYAGKDLKLPGHIQAKDYVSIDSMEPGLYGNYTTTKMSSWPLYVKKEEFEKLAVQLESQPDVSASFVDNTGDLISNIITMKDNEEKIISDTKRDGILDLKNVINAKRVTTAIDSEMFDVSQLKPMIPPSVCELRLYEYPTMEDFMESGASMVTRFQATKVGKPVTGVLIDCKDEDELDKNDNYHYPKPTTNSSDNDTEVRNRRPQIFISSDGKFFSEYSDYNKTGIGYYGSNILTSKGALEKVIGLIKENTSDQFLLIDEKNRNDGADKSFEYTRESNQGVNDFYDGATLPSSSNILIVYGAGDAYECIKFRGHYKRYTVNDSKAYVSNSSAIIMANIASPQIVSSVDDPKYKMIIGSGKKRIILVPEGSIVINSAFMKDINNNEFMSPSKTIQKVYEEAAINKTAVYLDPSNKGYRIEGEAFEPLKKIAGFSNDRILSTGETTTALEIMGMEKEAASNVLKVALNRYLEKSAEDRAVSIYGLRDDYINTDVFKEREKLASIKDIYRQLSDDLRVDLIKEASVLSDPAAVDVVLSLNYINEDNLRLYVDNISKMKEVVETLAQLLVASRMGLSDMDESALKKSMEGLQDVITGLENIKIAIGE